VPEPVAEQCQLSVVVLFDGAAVADADRNTSYSKNSSASSTAEVASSRNTALGLSASNRANAMRCCSPGESTFDQSRISSRWVTRLGNATLLSTSCKVLSSISPATAG
jgi:hypothetical protein